MREKPTVARGGGLEVLVVKNSLMVVGAEDMSRNHDVQCFAMKHYLHSHMI